MADAAPDARSIWLNGQAHPWTSGLTMAGLLTFWKYAPDRLPPALQPVALIRLLGIKVEAGSPARKPAPPESQYNE